MSYSAALAALGDPTRREIFDRLRRRPQAVGELAAELPVSRPAVSKHLRVLKEAGLVMDEVVGTRRVYRPEPATLAELRRYFDEFWADALEQYVEFAASRRRPPAAD